MIKLTTAVTLPLILLFSTLGAADKSSTTSALSKDAPSSPAPSVEAVATAPAADCDSFDVGGVRIAFPSPSASHVEVGYAARAAMDTFVPPTNKLICAFVLKDQLAPLQAGSPDLVLESYSMVEIARGVESTDLTPADFVDVVKETKRAMGESLDQIISEGNDILRDKLKDLDVGEVSVSAPKNLGTVFDKPDNYGTILVCRVQGGGRDMTVAIGIGFIRVKNRLIFMNLYEEYKNEDSILRLKRSLEAWTDATLAANK